MDTGVCSYAGFSPFFTAYRTSAVCLAASISSFSGFQHLCVFQHLRISQFSFCPVDLHFRFSSCSAASGRTFFYRILSRYSFDRIRLIFSANNSVAVAAEIMSETGSA